MMDCNEMKNCMENGIYDSVLKDLYGENINEQKVRYLQLINRFEQHFPNHEQIEIYSASGRSEIGGNHTDHQHGCVLAASINLDSVAVVSPTDDATITVLSEGFEIPVIQLNSLDIQKEEEGTSAALIRGVAAALVKNGYAIGGFCAYMNSEVLSGSGLSSSASFEVLIATILSHLYNKGSIAPVVIAQISQYAENIYFKKPCGLMDQMACAVGGFVAIDFHDISKPIIEQIHYDLSASKHSLCIVDTLGNHADLTNEYAAIPKEMKQIANHFGCDYLRDVDVTSFVNAIPVLREQFCDRSVLRAMHFFQENTRAKQEALALQNQDFSQFLSLIKESGDSSYKYLQNVYSCKDYKHQSMSMALCLAEHLLQGKGAIRVHGGGFAGTIQCFVPNDVLAHFQTNMEKIFGKGSCHVLMVRPCGGIKVA